MNEWEPKYAPRAYFNEIHRTLIFYRFFFNVRKTSHNILKNKKEDPKKMKYSKDSKKIKKEDPKKMKYSKDSKKIKKRTPKK